MTPTYHDPNKVLLGATQSSERDITCEDADPATFKAGLAVRRASDGKLSLSSGGLIGVSLGRSLSDTVKTAVARTGLRVPVQLTDEGVAAALTEEDLTFTARQKGVEGNDISIALVTGGTAGAEVVTVDGLDIEVEIEGGVSTATQVKAALDNSPEAMALIEVTISGTASDAQAAFAKDNLEGGDGLYVGAFEGVTGFASTDKTFAKTEAAKPNRNVFFKKVGTGSKNMLFAFGKLLSNLVNWRNQQFITMPFNDDVDELGEANSLFDDRISFVLNDDEFGNRLAFFVAGGKAIIAPYILKNLRIDMQSRALQWIAQNQPQYTIKEASLLEARIQEDVLNSYIARGWIETGSIRITLVEQNFVASGTITVPTPKALWRVFNEMTETN